MGSRARTMGIDLPEAIPIEVDDREVLRLQGYRRPTDIPTPPVLEILREARREAEALLAPRYVFEVHEVAEVTPGEVRLSNGRRLRLERAAQRWGRFDRIGLGVCTIGDGLERRVDALIAAREFPVAFMLDSMGWAAVESLAVQLNNLVCNRLIGDSIKATYRLSPGYTGWDIWDQRTLFDLLPADRIGVRINEYCVMIPGKSLSFGIGIGPEVRVEQSSKCERCDLRGCVYRLAPYRGGLAPAPPAGGPDRGWDLVLGKIHGHQAT